MVPAGSMQKVAVSLPEMPTTVLLATLPPCKVSADPLGQPPDRSGLGSNVTVVLPPSAQWMVDGEKNGAATVPEPPVGPVHPDSLNVAPGLFTPVMALQVTGMASAPPVEAVEHPLASAPAASALNHRPRRIATPRRAVDHRPRPPRLAAARSRLRFP